MIRLTSAMTLNAVLTAAKTTNDMSVMVGFSDDSTTGYAGSSTLSTTNGVTPVAICAAPGAFVIRDIDLINIYNADTAAKIIQIYVTASAVNYLLLDITLQVDDTLTYTHADGWRITDLNGNLKTTLSGGTASQITAAGWAAPAGPIGSTTPVQYYNRVSATVTAAGATQVTATQLVAERNKVTTAPVGSGVILPTPLSSGLDVWVDNDTVNALNLYPQIGGQIDTLGVNAPMVIPPGGSVMLSAPNTTQWDSYLSNNQAFTTVSTTGLATLGQLLINGTNSTSAFQEQIAGSITFNNAAIYAQFINTTLTGGAATIQLFGNYNGPSFTPSVAATTEYGLLNVPTHNSGFAPTTIHCNYGAPTLGASALGGTISSINGYVAAPPTINVSATTNVTTYTQFYALNVTQGAAQTITNVYAFRGGQASGTNRWNLYMDGTANNAIAANTKFGAVTVPTCPVDVAGPIATQAPSTVNTANYTVVATDSSLRFTTTNCTVTLPAPASFTGRWLYMNTITANSVTSAGSNVIPLGSNTPGTAILAATAGKFAALQSDGTNWITMWSN